MSTSVGEGVVEEEGKEKDEIILSKIETEYLEADLKALGEMRGTPYTCSAEFQKFKDFNGKL